MKPCIRLLLFSVLLAVINDGFCGDEQLISSCINKYHNIEALVADKKVTVEEFQAELQMNLEYWLTRDFTAIWITIPLECAAYIPLLLRFNFKPHHITDKELVMALDYSDRLPAWATHTVGVAGIVIDDQNRILIVIDRDKPELGYKLPGGGLDIGEDIRIAAMREIKEETGIDTEFLGIIAWRHHRGHKGGISDIYFACLLRPLSYTIERQEDEISDCLWMPYDEFKKVAANSCAQFLSAYEKILTPYVGNNVGAMGKLTFYAPGDVSLPTNHIFEK